MRLIEGQDVEASLKVIRQWSRENLGSSTEWKNIHAASNVLAIRLYDGAQYLAAAREAVSDAKQKLKQAEAVAKLTALGLLLQGKATLPTGERLTEKVSYSVAKDLSSHFVPNDPAVIQANADLLKAEAVLTALDQKLEALREISQGAKSTAKLLTDVGLG